MDGLTLAIIDFLRKGAEEKAQGPNMAPRRPQPGMLGSGGAAQAGKMVSGRDKQVMDYVNEAGR